MEKQACCLILTKLHCVHSTAESGHDDVFFEVYAGNNGSETFLGRYFADNPLHMNGKSDDDSYIDVEFNQSDVGSHNYIDYIRVRLWDNDSKNGWQSGDPRDLIGDAYIYRDDPLDSYKVIDQTSGKAEAEYKLYYRVIDKPIQTLRVFGIYCEEDSKGCNVDAVEEVFALAEKAAEEASDAIGKSPRPRAKAVSKGFEVASEILGNISNLVVWIADSAEGKDEIYIQHVDRDSHDIQGGGWPQDGKPYKMEKGDEVEFGENGVEYIRVPLDQGKVTLQLREQDPITGDNCLGGVTVDESYYNDYKDEGGTIVVADQFFRDQSDGQGALYQLCISVGMENWALPATIDAQES